MFFLLAAGNLNICLHEARYLLLQPNTDWDLKFCFLYVPFAFAFVFCFFLHFFVFFLFWICFFFWLLFCFTFFHIFCGKNIPWFYRIWLEAVNITQVSTATIQVKPASTHATCAPSGLCTSFRIPPNLLVPPWQQVALEMMSQLKFHFSLPRSLVSSLLARLRQLAGSCVGNLLFIPGCKAPHPVPSGGPAMQTFPSVQLSTRR